MAIYHVYIMSNTRRTTLYIGATGNIERRIKQHRSGKIHGFTERYNCTDLVYFEYAADKVTAFRREKQLKKWSRAKKLALISQINPELQNLSISADPNVGVMQWDPSASKGCKPR